MISARTSETIELIPAPLQPQSDQSHVESSGLVAALCLPAVVERETNSPTNSERPSRALPTDQVAFWGSDSQEYNVAGVLKGSTTIRRRRVWIAEWVKHMLLMLAVAITLLLAEYPLGILGKAARVVWKVCITVAKWLGISS